MSRFIAEVTVEVTAEVTSVPMRPRVYRKESLVEFFAHLPPAWRQSSQLAEIREFQWIANGAIPVDFLADAPGVGNSGRGSLLWGSFYCGVLSDVRFSSVRVL